MRDFIFRAKPKGAKGWMHGSLIYFNDSQTAHIIPYGSYKSGHIVCEFCEADKSTIGMFTRVLDMDGNRIYEGDIVEVTIENIGPNKPDVLRAPVFYSYHNGRFEFGEMGDFLYLARKGDLKIVGNIYDGEKRTKEE